MVDLKPDIEPTEVPGCFVASRWDARTSFVIHQLSQVSSAVE
jgi:hypothetical protein